MENQLNEEVYREIREEINKSTASEESGSESLWEKVGQLASINDMEEYVKESETIIPLIFQDLQQVNNNTRLLFGRPGDVQPWVLNENKRVKLYRMVQKIADLLPGEAAVRIKNKAVPKTIETYQGILELKICMAIVQVFADSYRKVLPVEENYTRLRMDLTYIFNTSLEIDHDIGKALESNKHRKFTSFN